MNHKSLKRMALISGLVTAMLPTMLPTASVGGKIKPDSSASDTALTKRIARIIDSYANLGRFSGAVLVASNGRVMLSKGYGLASIEYGAPNTPRTRFDLGSLSKQFTAAAILKLESEGKLSTNDPVIKYLPDYPKPQAEIVTIHHLLSHTSGIPSLGQRGGIPDPPNRGNEVKLNELIALFKDRPLQFKPGEKYRYNNSGYILLAAIIEKASGQIYDSYLRKMLFEPAGMHDTGRIPTEVVVPQLATGYMGYAPRFAKPAYVHPSWAIGAGGIYSNVEDLFKWDQALYEGTILPAAQTEKLFKAQVSRGRPGHDYAYGWFVDDVYGHTAINHGGTTEGFLSAYYRFPKERIFIVVLSNYMPRLGIDNSDKIADSISAAFFGAEYSLPPEPVKLSAKTLRRFAGEYQFDPGHKLRLEVRNDQLVSKTEGAQSWTLPTYSSQSKLEQKAAKVTTAARIVRAFVEGDYRSVLELAAPARRAEISPEDVIRTSDELKKTWGNLIRITPFAVTKDGSVRNRVSFTNGEMFMLIEFNKQDEFVGWFYGNAMMPAEVALIPVSPTKFYVDGFRYDEGAAWGEHPVFLEFTSQNGNVSGVCIKQDEVHCGKKSG